MFINPVIRRFPNFTAYIIFWLLIALINFIVLAAGLKLEIIYAAVDSFVFIFLLALLALSFWFPVQYIPFEKSGALKPILSHFTGSIAVSALWIITGYFILTVLLPDIDYQNFLINSLGWRFLSGIVFYFFITAFYYVVIYYSKLQEKSIKEAELQNLITQAELRTLKFQINPHFIFNSLNSLSALTITDPERAHTMTLKISDFLRYALSNNDKQKNLFTEEIHNLHLYIDIERVRFDNKFEFSEEIDITCKDAEMPNMILQPLIENAFKHAVYESEELIRIRLKCHMDKGNLLVTLSNNYEESTLLKKGAGLGLKNIAGRLELMYHRKGLLNIKNEEGIFSVTLVIPQVP